AQEAKRGFGSFLFLLCFLSVQLGVLNLLPIPVLDGGHFAFMLYEGIRGRPMGMKKRLLAQQVGLVLLLGLMVFVTFNDINRVWGFGNIWEGIKGLFG
ncbi:MAG: site-2 protease family protein, partial [Deltaproteobacteria bacterium]|nr:site-2 protease family protein [Deltaproteobacteria bacterium]